MLLEPSALLLEPLALLLEAVAPDVRLVAGRVQQRHARPPGTRQSPAQLDQLIGPLQAVARHQDSVTDRAPRGRRPGYEQGRRERTEGRVGDARDEQPAEPR